GDLDLFVTAYKGPNRLYQNSGGLVFVEVTAVAGLPIANATTSCAAATDYDRDGDLDLYVGNYGDPALPTPDTNYMYRNNGDGTFTDVTGLTGTADSTRQTLAATFFDYNNDGWEDLYVSNDRIDFRNALYQNNGDGTFSDVSASSGTDITIDAMNVGIGDYDNNGHLDIYVTNTFAGSVFLKNNGNGTFTDVAPASGTLFSGHVGWGGTQFDFDNDLDLDLYVSCSIPFSSLPNGFFINDGSGIFAEPYAATGGLQGIDFVRGFSNAVGDFNHDGKYDIAVCNIQPDSLHIWENIDTNSNHWFKLKLVGTSSNRNAIGAWIEVWIDGQKYLRTTHTHQAFMAQYSHTMIIGTGSHEAIDSLVVRWPYPSAPLPYTKQMIPGCAITMSAVNCFTEGQALPTSSHMVTSTDNAGPATLRDMIDGACHGDTIMFDASLANDTITLSGAPLLLDKDLMIQASGIAGLVIRVADTSATVTVSQGVTVSIAGLEFLDGAVTPPDPMITNYGTLVLENMTLTSQNALANGQTLIRSHGMLSQKGVIQVLKQ
ncbi:MAG: CRTAC1 family protein, partial [Saprospiraceae bacterium]|nr:CRTAC1 family protein [Saprospiraceae bacterium]